MHRTEFDFDVIGGPATPPAAAPRRPQPGHAHREQARTRRRQGRAGPRPCSAVPRTAPRPAAALDPGAPPYESRDP